jgi:ATP-binding cassette subfamily A (ABC1) protein 3
MAFLTGLTLYTIIGQGDASSSQIEGLCISAPACFGASLTSLGELEKAELGVNAGTVFTVVYNVSTGGTVLLYFLDCAIYLFLTWYFDKVLPSEYGVRKPWYFLFQRDFWCPKDKSGGGTYAKVDDKDEFAKLVDPESNAFYQRPSSEFESVDGVRIRSLRKQFLVDGNQFVAVQSLNLDMFEGEVFALLGHNGAGK